MQAFWLAGGSFGRKCLRFWGGNRAGPGGVNLVRGSMPGGQRPKSAGNSRNRAKLLPQRSVYWLLCMAAGVYHSFHASRQRISHVRCKRI